MISISAYAVARIKRAACIMALIGVGTIAYAAINADPVTAGSAPNTSPAVKPADVATPSTTVGKNAAKKAPVPPVKPLWIELTPAQQEALAPLAAEWDKLDTPHKKKWLAISKKYATLKPDQQVRLQDRMRDWVKLTPEQRRVARESYSRAKKLNPTEKSAEWQQYQQLPEEQKKKLADDAAAKKRVTNLPPASQNKGKITPPPKSAQKGEAAQSMNPSLPANQSSVPLPLQPAIK
jgi:hypothetical protein